MSIISKRFELVDEGPFSHYLGVEALYKDGSSDIYVSQRTYIDNVLRRFGWQNLKPSPTPFNDKVALPPPSDDTQASPDEVKAYQERIGVLIWLMTTTRPDIAYAANKLAQYAKNPSPAHHQAV